MKEFAEMCRFFGFGIAGESFFLVGKAKGYLEAVVNSDERKRKRKLFADRLYPIKPIAIIDNLMRFLLRLNRYRHA
jgi:hypothetical protein